MKKLLDVTDRRTRLLQHASMAGCGLLAGAGIAMFRHGPLPPAAAGVLIVAAVVLLVLTAGIKQRWEIEYRGHRIRFENSAVTAERLFLDEGLVARGGVGMKMELRAPIRVGEGAGDTIVALVDAGVGAFRLRIFIETDDPAAVPASATLPHTPPEQRYAGAQEQLQPVRQSAVLGGITLAKHVFEFLASVIGVIGGLIALATWFR